MDNGLVRDCDDTFELKSHVLILIVVEDGLVLTIMKGTKNTVES